MFEAALNETESRRLKVGVAVTGFVGLALLARAFAARGPAGAAPKQEALPVATAIVSTKTVSVELHETGRVEAVRSASVRSPVNGAVVKIHFRPGQTVSEGDLLFTLAPGPFRAALDGADASRARDLAAEREAEAVLERDRGLLKRAESEAARYAGLFEQGIASRLQVKERQKAVEALAAAVKAGEAAAATRRANLRASQTAMEKARDELAGTRVRAPIGGKTGSLRIGLGSLVKPDDPTPLVTIAQPSPVYVTFSVPEQHASRINEASAAGSVEVLTTPPGDESNPEAGRLTFIDNATDTATRTLRLKATFRNAGQRLWPGQLARVTLVLGPRPDATVVPSEAVQTGLEGPYVYVVTGDTVQPRPVKTGGVVEKLTVVEKGLRPGERVVTAGQRRLYPGARVEPKHS